MRDINMASHYPYTTNDIDINIYILLLILVTVVKAELMSGCLLGALHTDSVQSSHRKSSQVISNNRS